MASRAIHLDLLNGMSSDCFIISLGCFIATRGNISLLRYDNGTNYVGAYNELNNEYNNIISDETLNSFLDKSLFKIYPP